MFRCFVQTVNLVCNAAQVVTEGFIEVVFQRTESDCSIRVTDSGPGLKPSQLPELFERYKQMRPGRTGGSGLGLVLAQQIAKAFGSEIVVKSPWQKGGQSGTSMEMLLRDCISTQVDHNQVAINVAGLELAAAVVDVDEFAVARALKGILVVEDEKMNQMVRWLIERRSHSLADPKSSVVAMMVSYAHILSSANRPRTLPVFLLPYFYPPKHSTLQIMRAKLSQVQGLVGSEAEVQFVDTAEEGLTMVSADLDRFDLILVGSVWCGVAFSLFFWG